MAQDGRRTDAFGILDASGFQIGRIQPLSHSLIGTKALSSAHRESVVQLLGCCGPAAALWLDGLPGHDALYQGFLQNEGSLVRLRTLLTEAPSLLEAYASPNLTKILLTGGADPSADSEERLHELPTTCSLNQLAESFAVGWYGACLTWLIAPDFDLGH
jgi:hypothetical protein